MRSGSFPIGVGLTVFSPVARETSGTETSRHCPVVGGGSSCPASSHAVTPPAAATATTATATVTTSGSRDGRPRQVVQNVPIPVLSGSSGNGGHRSRSRRRHAQSSPTNQGAVFLTNSVLVRLCGAAQTSTSTSLTVDRRNRLAERRLNTTVLARCLRRRVAACRSIARPTAGGSGISLSMVLAMTNRILVIGATGHLGSRTAERATAAGWSAVGTYFSSPLEAACEQL